MSAVGFEDPLRTTVLLSLSLCVCVAFCSYLPGILSSANSLPDDTRQDKLTQDREMVEHKGSCRQQTTMLTCERR